MVASIATQNSRVPAPLHQQRPASQQVAPPRNDGRPTGDRVDLGAPRQETRVGFGVDLAYGRQRVQAPRVGATPHRLNEARSLTVEFAFALPEVGASGLDELVNEEQKRALGKAIERLAEEGVDSEAFAVFEEAAGALFAEYEDDLGLGDGKLDDARQVLVDEVRSFFAAGEASLGRPLLSAPHEGEIYERYSLAVHDLRSRIERGRQGVLEASGHVREVLAELVTDTRVADHAAEARELLGRVGDFLERLRKHDVESQGAAGLQAEAREQLLAPPPPVPPATETQVALGRSFLAALAV